ncbi:tol-pal system protein YbgF [Halomonas sp. HP20-15]|uniref:tol-pal system protein YbgF n=1 Tax=Halomonas sp. HP20-15 TaxID=3085901 RepID=UPI0029816D8B|nr:tol-pal system protein YbgF [Halomonas sp. HP20-15]MDW5375543.1 tol-pal system protein YbgF [Halomonas sp. HP20-15]
MKHSLKGLCGAGALVLPLSVWAAPVVEDLSANQQSNLYQQTQVRPEAGGNLVLFNQLQDNQRQIQELRGQIEELRYQLEQQKNFAQERYLELEKRISGFAASGGGNTAQGGGTPSSAEQGDNSDAAVAAADQEDRQAYQAAFQKVQARDFDAALTAFESFVKNHPDSPLRANGYYWLGELYSARSELEPAAQAFTTVIEDYPQSNKVPDALYKLGLLKARQGQPEASKQLLNRVQQEYPDSNAASMAGDFLNQSGL